MTVSEGSIMVTGNPVQMHQRMWTKVQWVRGFKREWKSVDNSFQDFCYIVDREIRSRQFYLKMEKKHLCMAKGKSQR